MAVFVFLAFLCVYAVRAFVAEPFAIVSDSMSPTLEPGDRILVDRRYPHATFTLSRGDIVVLSDPESSGRRLVKRIAALPGDTIRVIDDVLWVGEVRLDVSPRADLPGFPELKLDYPITLGEGQLFVLGDHPSGSRDSRSFGPVSASSIVGRASAIYWPHDRFHVFEE